MRDDCLPKNSQDEPLGQGTKWKVSECGDSPTPSCQNYSESLLEHRLLGPLPILSRTIQLGREVCLCMLALWGHGVSPKTLRWAAVSLCRPAPSRPVQAPRGPVRLCSSDELPGSTPWKSTSLKKEQDFVNRTKGTQGKRNRCSERFGGLEEHGVFGEQQDFPGRRIMGRRKGVRGRKR